MAVAKNKVIKMGGKCEIPDAQRELYEITMENLKELSSRNGAKPFIKAGSVPLSLCFIDDRYQGYRTHKGINKLQSEWDERFLAPIALVPHPEECRFAATDGQARIIVAGRLGYKSLQAYVIMDAPEDLDERLKFEADYFIRQDKVVEHLKTTEKHLARVIIGDKPASDLDAILKKYNVKVINKKGCRSESVLGSYPTAYDISKVHGKKCLDFIFSIINNAGWNHEKNGYASYIMVALSNIWTVHQKEEKEIVRYLSDEFRKIDPQRLNSFSQSKYVNRDTRVRCTLYTEDLVCEGLNLERKIFPDTQSKRMLVIA